MADQPSDTEPPETDAAQAGADIEQTVTASAQQEHTVRTEPAGGRDKQRPDHQLTTDPQAQDTSTVIDPTAS